MLATIALVGAALLDDIDAPGPGHHGDIVQHKLRHADVSGFTARLRGIINHEVKSFGCCQLFSGGDPFGTIPNGHDQAGRKGGIQFLQRGWPSDPDLLKGFLHGARQYRSNVRELAGQLPPSDGGIHRSNGALAFGLVAASMDEPGLEGLLAAGGLRY